MTKKRMNREVTRKLRKGSADLGGLSVHVSGAASSNPSQPHSNKIAINERRFE